MNDEMMRQWDEHIAAQVALQERILKSELPRLQAAAARKIYLEMKAQGFDDEQALNLTGVMLGAGMKTGGV